MSADQLPTPFSPLFRLIDRLRQLSAVASSAPDSFRRGVGADNGTAVPRAGSVASPGPAVPPSNKNRLGTVNPEAAVGGPAWPQKQVTY